MSENYTQRAWYLQCEADEIAERAVLVGDRGRVLLAADMLSEAKLLNEDRGLTTVTGKWNGVPVTVSAFGMGAAIAVVVLHELSALGVRSVVRLGTVMSVGRTALGDLVVADSALRREATSATYVPDGYPAAPDVPLTTALAEASRAVGRPVTTGMVASFDGFYSQMFHDPTMPGSTAADLDELTRLGVVALDMETSAVLAVGRALGVRAASLCLASVDGLTHSKLAQPERKTAEADLMRAGLDALSATELTSKENAR